MFLRSTVKVNGVVGVDVNVVAVLFTVLLLMIFIDLHQQYQIGFRIRPIQQQLLKLELIFSPNNRVDQHFFQPDLITAIWLRRSSQVQHSLKLIIQIFNQLRRTIQTTASFLGCNPTDRFLYGIKRIEIRSFRFIF